MYIVHRSLLSLDLSQDAKMRKLIKHKVLDETYYIDKMNPLV